LNDLLCTASRKQTEQVSPDLTLEFGSGGGGAEAGERVRDGAGRDAVPRDGNGEFAVGGHTRVPITTVIKFHRPRPRQSRRGYIFTSPDHRAVNFSPWLPRSWPRDDISHAHIDACRRRAARSWRFPVARRRREQESGGPRERRRHARLQGAAWARGGGSVGERRRRHACLEAAARARGGGGGGARFCRAARARGGGGAHVWKRQWRGREKVAAHASGGSGARAAHLCGSGCSGELEERLGLAFYIYCYI
jgi:hypothetical protein